MITSLSVEPNSLVTNGAMKKVSVSMELATTTLARTRSAVARHVPNRTEKQSNARFAKTDFKSHLPASAFPKSAALQSKDASSATATMEFLPVLPVKEIDNLFQTAVHSSPADQPFPDATNVTITTTTTYCPAPTVTLPTSL